MSSSRRSPSLNSRPLGFARGPEPVEGLSTPDLMSLRPRACGSAGSPPRATSRGRGGSNLFPPHSVFPTRHSGLGTRHSNFGFTLVEILVVLAIIAILSGLLLAGVMQARIAARKVAAVTFMKNLGTALLQYREDFGAFPPSSAVASTWLVHWETGVYTGKVFTALNTVNSGADADEALVYFLGTRFEQFTATQQSDRNYPPDWATITRGPYMEFPGAVLTRDTDADGWPELLDPFGTPYCYVPSSEYLTPITSEYLRGTIIPGHLPYANPPDPPYNYLRGDFFNQSTWQVMSAGPDMAWPSPPPTPQVTVTSGRLGLGRQDSPLSDDLNNW